jgi:hypothetical protein
MSLTFFKDDLREQPLFLTGRLDFFQFKEGMPIGQPETLQLIEARNAGGVVCAGCGTALRTREDARGTR